MVIYSLNFFIKHFLDPQVRAMGDGHFVRELLNTILSPPTYWLAVFEAYQSDALHGDPLETFAHLCCEVVLSHHSCLDKPYFDIKKIMSEGALIESPHPEVRSWAYRIEKVLQRVAPTDLIIMDSTAGGRHDNDFADFRKIVIYPTNDELRSKEEPFLQRATEVFSIPEENRANIYRDWLFRLLREDMLADLRGEVSTSLDRAKAKRPLIRYHDLSLPDGVQSALTVRPLTLMVQCRVGISFPKNVSTAEARQQYLKDNKNFVKHGSFGVLRCKSSTVRVYAMP
ncbi:hypothetical protein CDD81_972 [Ophiocordyceps australis]|uniref:Uncharacterized protein n=1 Tax=Ophiocordyceps australis TaxID=1399860 RepID=A0A2C5Y008_9HYPO|nr:hypothetical protein CDD81_972 [Ophiocordyceps australis]